MKLIVISKTFVFERRCPGDLVPGIVCDELRSIENHMAIPARETVTVEVKDE